MDIISPLTLARSSWYRDQNAGTDAPSFARLSLAVDTVGHREDGHSVMERWIEPTHHVSPGNVSWAGPYSGAGGEPSSKYFDLSALFKFTQSPVIMTSGHGDLDRDELPVAWQNVSALISLRSCKQPRRSAVPSHSRPHAVP